MAPLPVPAWMPAVDGALKEFHSKFRELACVDFQMCEPPVQAKGG